ncbi:MAG: dicarboxylate/amino acid:cation symporter [Candidatus Omnitrophota bacterium]|jgi:Na+/H+-dicarboxylate symporter
MTEAACRPSFIKHYGASCVLLGAIATGAVLGILLGGRAAVLKPFGDIFLNLLFTAVVPLVFFSIASAIAEMADLGRLGKILLWMIVIFVATGLISSSLMVLAVQIYPPTADVSLPSGLTGGMAQAKSAAQILSAFTVPDFADLLSKKNMMALILFSVLTGLASAMTREKAKAFSDFLSAGNQVMMKVIALIMLYAPVGLGAYFAYLVGVFGPELLKSYLRVVALYYPVSLLYFLVGYSLYALLAAGLPGVRTFWSCILTPALTALGTGSSLATVPSNIRAADEIGVPRDISRIVIPVGATIHMDGTCISAIVKISLLFTLFGKPFTGFETLATAVGIALLSGMVMSGIPGGGFTGELLIVTLYGFPPEALPIISMVGTLVDPPATAVNAIGSNTTSMLIARILGGKNWLPKLACFNAIR